VELSATVQVGKRGGRGRPRRGEKEGSDGEVVAGWHWAGLLSVAIVQSVAATKTRGGEGSSSAMLAWRGRRGGREGRW